MISTHPVYYPLYHNTDKPIILITGGRGCEAPWQKVIMADLTVKEIKDIKEGDFVMGDDGSPRKVLATMSGHSRMYKVHQTSGEDYYVNDAHILTLADEDGDLHDIPILDYLQQEGTRKLYGVKADLKTFALTRHSISVKPACDGDWCGICLDGNQRYLHSDGTVTHNSGKSFAVSTFLERLSFEMKHIINERGERENVVHNILFSRYTMTSAELSVIPEFLEKVEADGTGRYFHATKQDVLNTQSGSKIMFRGIKTSSGNQTAKLKSIHGITTFVCDEAEEWQSEKEFMTIMLSIRQKGIQNRIIIVMNPTDKHHFIYKNYIENTHKIEYFDGVPVQISTHPSVLHIHTTYLDNINNLSEEFLKETRRLKEFSPAIYEHTIMGRWADEVEGVVFDNWDIIDSYPQGLKHEACGLDFGYSNDSSACVRCGVSGINDLYIDELFYKTGMLSNDIVAELKNKCPNLEIMADSADPRLIQEISNGGVWIYPVAKPAGSILAGIDKMKAMKIHVTRRSVNLINELRNYTWQKDKDGEFINKPIDAFNHCFTGDTLVTTDKGEKRIDGISVGDMVLTSQGYKPVTKVFDNGNKKVISVVLSYEGEEVRLTATPDHKIKTSQGWIELRNLKKGMRIFLAKPSMGKNTDYTEESAISQEEREDSMLSYGNSITAKFRRGIMYTTKMKTQQTTISQILNSLRHRNICKDTHKKNLQKKENWKGCEKRWITHVSSPTLGMVARKDVCGIVDTPKSRISNPKSLYVNTAARHTLQETLARTDFVPTIARLHGVENRDMTTKHESVNIAVRSSNTTSISNETIAFHRTAFTSNVQRVQRDDVQPCREIVTDVSLQQIQILDERVEHVYDIEVDEAHEFFANGVLVHNCIDSVRYFVYGKLLGNILQTQRITADDLPY